MSFEEMMVFQNDIKAIIIVGVIICSALYGLISLFKKKGE